MVCGDVPHRGVEITADCECYRIHVYCDPTGIRSEDKIDKDHTVSADLEMSYPGIFLQCW